MQSLYQAMDGLEARLLVDALAAEHIEALVLGEYLSGAAGELSAFNYPTVWVVESSQIERARDVLKRFLEARNSPDPGDDGEWQCPACGTKVDAGFALCWNCGTPRPDA
jgi:hypothetical protein